MSVRCKCVNTGTCDGNEIRWLRIASRMKRRLQTVLSGGEPVTGLPERINDFDSFSTYSPALRNRREPRTVSGIGRPGPKKPQAPGNVESGRRPPQDRRQETIVCPTRYTRLQKRHASRLPPSPAPRPAWSCPSSCWTTGSKFLRKRPRPRRLPRRAAAPSACRIP